MAIGSVAGALLSAITMMTSANGYVRSTTDPVMRGRVMAPYMAIFMGARWSMAVAAASGIIAALIGLVWIIRARGLRLSYNRRARGLRQFGVVSRLGDNAHGAAREEDPDDAVGR